MQRFCASVIEVVEKDPETEIAQVVLKDAASGPKEILNKEIQVTQKDSDTSGPKGSSNRPEGFTKAILKSRGLSGS